MLFLRSLTPAEKIVGSYLGVFDIYHSWYYQSAFAGSFIKYRFSFD